MTLTYVVPSPVLLPSPGTYYISCMWIAHVYVDGSRISADAKPWPYYGYAKNETVAGSVLLPLQAGQVVGLYVNGKTSGPARFMFSGLRIFTA